MANDPTHMLEPKVSILMATYNGARYLDAQIQSILNQSHKNLEIIIQDDGSKDDTMAILRRYAAMDDRIQVCQNTENLGINANFYSLIRKSSGDYIAISDQDDIWIDHKIEYLLQAIGDASLVYTDSTLIDAESNPLGTTILETLGHAPKQGRLLTDLFEANTVSGHACMFDSKLKSLFCRNSEADFGEKYIYDQLIATIASFRNGVVYYDTPLTLHRMHGKNHCNNFYYVEQESEKAISSENTNRGKKVSEQRHISFWKQKILRVEGKILKARSKYEHLERIFFRFSLDEQNPFYLANASRAEIEKGIFNVKLYRALKSCDIHRAVAREISSGSVLFYLLRFF